MSWQWWSALLDNLSQNSKKRRRKKASNPSWTRSHDMLLRGFYPQDEIQFLQQLGRVNVAGRPPKKRQRPSWQRQTGIIRCPEDVRTLLFTLRWICLIISKESASLHISKGSHKMHSHAVFIKTCDVSQTFFPCLYFHKTSPLFSLLQTHFPFLLVKRKQQVAI